MTKINTNHSIKVLEESKEGPFTRYNWQFGMLIARAGILLTIADKRADKLEFSIDTAFTSHGLISMI